MTGLDETTLIPAEQEALQVGQRLEDAVVGHGGVDDAVGAEREQRVDVARRPRRRACGPRPASSPASRPDLVRVGDEEPDELEVGAGVDAGEGVPAHVAGAPLDDSVGHGGGLFLWLERGGAARRPAVGQPGL